jgi:hypothetical protein
MIAHIHTKKENLIFLIVSQQKMKEDEIGLKQSNRNIKSLAYKSTFFLVLKSSSAFSLPAS